MRRIACFCLLAFLLAAGTAAAAPDPLAPGPYAVTKLAYEDGTEIVGGGSTQYSFPQAVKGEISLPVGAGPFPVVVLLHGRHQTCAVGGEEIIYPVPPCPGAPPASQSVDSYRGYDALAQALAAHGYIVDSIDANGDNGYDLVAADGGAYARAQTIAVNLDRLAKWNAADGPAPVGGALRGKVDLSRIGLMGHSRGGEGVSEFIAYAKEKAIYPGVRAVMALAPVDFGAQAPAGVAWGTILPLCDGDVFDLQGAQVYERTKALETDPAFARVQFGVAGANHNWFNSVWTNDDEAGSADSACGGASGAGLRMSMADQQRVGAALMAAFLRRYTRPEPALDPYLTGELGLPGAACPAGGACDDRVQISYAAAARERRTILAPEPTGPLATAQGAAVESAGFASAEVCTAGPTNDSVNRTQVNTCPATPTRSTTSQLAIAWDGPAHLRMPLGGDAADVRSFRALTLRAGAVFGDTARNPAGVSQDFDVVLIDSAGRSAAVSAADFDHGALIPARGGASDPSGDERELLLGGVRIPLERFDGVDLAHLAAVELRMSGRGSLQLADVAFQEAAGPAADTGGAAAPPPAAVPCRPARAVRVDLRRVVSRRLVRASVRAGRLRLRVTRALVVRVPLGGRASVRIVVRGRLRNGRKIRRSLTVHGC
jgi:hypothetical protein